MANPQAEPSMDEILASIRRIIAEEDEPQSDAASESFAPDTSELVEQPEIQDVVPEAADVAPETFDENGSVSFEEALPPEADDDVAAFFDQPEPVNGDVETQEEFGEDFTAEQDFAEAITVPADVPGDIEAVEVEKNPVFEAIEVQVQSAMKNVSASPASAGFLNDDTVAASSTAFDTLQENVKLSQTSGRTLEDVVEQLLQPLLKQWLDDNLTPIVEEKVEEEVRRIARRR